MNAKQVLRERKDEDVTRNVTEAAAIPDGVHRFAFPPFAFLFSTAAYALVKLSAGRVAAFQCLQPFEAKL